MTDLVRQHQKVNAESGQWEGLAEVITESS